MSMTPQEQAYEEFVKSEKTFYFTNIDMWNAACTWQREQDIKICNEFQRTSYLSIAKTLARLIKEQGENNEYEA